MKNMNKPLPDGVAFSTSETGQRGRVGFKKEKERKMRIKIKTQLIG